MKKTLAALVLGAVLTSSQAHAFGQIGHRAIGQIAQDHLNPEASAALQQIMGQEKLAWAATWPDEMRSSRDHKSFWKTVGTWHYANVPPGKTYQQAKKPANGDVIVAIRELIWLLKGKAKSDGPIAKTLMTRFGTLQSQEVKRYAVRLLVHFIGDLHQPLHVGYKKDYGGNKVEVEWFGEETNLHSVWDTSLVDNQKFSFTELVDKVTAGVSAVEKQAIQDSELMDWVAESMELRKVAYDVDKYDSEFSYSYVYDHTPLINSQILKAGLRTAAVFNEIFK